MYQFLTDIPPRESPLGLFLNQWRIYPTSAYALILSI